MSGEWYRSSEEKLRPGDIFRLAPALKALKAPYFALGNQTARSGRHYQEVFGLPGGEPIPGAQLEGRADVRLAVIGRFDLGVLLTRGCDVDNGKVRQLALIRSLDIVQGDGARSADENRASIVRGDVFNAHYLPPVPPSHRVSVRSSATRSSTSATSVRSTRRRSTVSPEP